ncbi:hypothetical protein VOLCADRAFT_103581 [Volvox carteri f. nagariensis]|uniref:RRM domain-containing protein n=1 Tax=Volvox carteri f. nagariensis TaxID=3068 RepID=D8TMY4_VOLCA|nr:uncharacterized protein VOLCADRAFT_103581 [Volvox carteri f. nagariensis]EFJ51333.1 hypothetical protein VOLCADRAFT_103581 [Volvox carteri f. nagariensis]|eukprot:XP_002947800.1 hypothetical protein VOLCADRAFT_103581 [Volvox carteri f. nagariensis]
MDIPPNQTIYINNLYEKLGKEELKKCLYAMFSQFGRIMDVVAMKTYRLRGQAWVVFTDTAAATNALRTMQGFPFFDKPIRITYAKGKSDAVAKVDGTYKPDKKQRAQKNAAAREAMLKRPTGGKAAGASVGGGSAQGAGGGSGLANAPNKILFVQNLPENSNEAMLGMLFQQFPGFREVRMVEARPGIAFVEFENDMQSTTAMQGLQGFKITPANAMNISYAKQ